MPNPSIKAVVYAGKHGYIHKVKSLNAKGKAIYNFGYYEQNDALLVARKEAKAFGLPVIFRLKEKSHV